MMTTVEERRAQIGAVEETEDGRWYLVGDQRLMSVTTALRSVAKPALPPWAASLAADTVFAELPTVVAASLTAPCGNTYSTCRRGPDAHPDDQTCEDCPCAACRDCVRRWLVDRHVAESSRRAAEGARTHHVIEQWVLNGGTVIDHDEHIAPYVGSFLAFADEYGITPESFLMTEAVVLNRDEGYAGTTDAIIRFRAQATEAAAKLVSRVTQVPRRKATAQNLGVDLVTDFKTREKPGAKFYPDHALQLSGYRFAPTVWVRALGLEVPMPATDGALIVQLRPDGATARLVVADRTTYEAGFLPAMRLYRWLLEHGPRSTSVSSFVLPETAAARDRKAAKKTATTTEAPEAAGVGQAVESTVPDGPSRTALTGDPDLWHVPF